MRTRVPAQAHTGLSRHIGRARHTKVGEARRSPADCSRIRLGVGADNRRRRRDLGQTFWEYI